MAKASKPVSVVSLISKRATKIRKPGQKWTDAIKEAALQIRAEQKK